MSDLLDRYFSHYSPLFLGGGRRGYANGMHATIGQLFPRSQGGYNLYRGQDSAGQIDWDDPVGASGKDATTIENFSDRPHDTAQVYYYAVRAISPGGVEQVSLEEVACLRFDAAGQAVIPPVHPPCNLQCIPIDGGRFRLNWTYRETERALSPQAFRIYGDAGTGSVDYNTVIATVAFQFWRRHYEHVTVGFTHDTRVIWSVRTVNSAGQEERNTNTAAAVADAEEPPINDGVRVE